MKVHEKPTIDKKNKKLFEQIANFEKHKYLQPKSKVESGYRTPPNFGI